jgi:iron complex transport system permease protein
MHSRVFLAGGLLAWVLTFMIALYFGSVSDADWSLIQELRLPRAVLAGAVGMGLAVAGAALQAIFSNPLCEPYTLGISSGAALGAVLGTTFDLNWNYAGLAGPAFLGALLFTAVLLIVSMRSGTGMLGLLLTGVMLSFLGSSLVAVWMAFADSSGLQGAIVWLMGNLSRARLEGALLSLACALLLSVGIWSRWRELDALLLGEEGAAALGVSVAPVRRRLILLSSLLVGLCVSGGGMIGFVGLMVPHFVRGRIGSLHLALLPACAVWGAASLTAADTLARVATRPYELPVGVVTAFIGAPLFVLILLKSGRNAAEKSGGLL